MKRKWGCLLLIPVLAVGLGVLRPVISGAASVIDLTKSCSLKVYSAADTAGFKEDLEEAGVVLDLYQIAEVEKMSGYDTYEYHFIKAYQRLSISNDPKTEEWKILAQNAANIALEKESNYNDIVKLKTGIETEKEIKELSPGLYLLIARGSDLQDYVVTVENEDGESFLATIAQSERYTYLFEPVLVSLPMKDAILDEATQEPLYHTANPGEWKYDWEVTLKPEQSQRYGSLEIVKQLTTYETKEPAIFVFSVDAVLDGETIYSDVESIIFTEAGEKKALVKTPLPAKAEVTVREIYTGSVYHLTTEASQTKEITADTVIQAEFANDYEEEQRGGHGIINEFGYEDGKWNHTLHRTTPEAAVLPGQEEEAR